jgi:hypothetical protein
MRAFAFIPLLLLAACSEASEPAKTEAEAPVAAELQAGQWEVASEVVSLLQRDKGSPAIKTPEGTKGSIQSCVAPADVKKPQPALFVDEKMKCTYRDIYMSGGRLNATLACSRPGLSGQISALVNGSFTATTLDATTVVETDLYSDGDVRIETKLTGRRTGECAPQS